VEEIGSPRTLTSPFSAKLEYSRGGNVTVAESFQQNSPHAKKGHRYLYAYDQLDRITGALHSHWEGGNTWNTGSAYQVSGITYDRNGNITALTRRNESGTIVDNLTYYYPSHNNRLFWVDDVAGKPTSWDVGLPGFIYDANGNVAETEDMLASTWYAFGYDERNLATTATNYYAGVTTNYRYNADGQRYWKKTGSQAGEYYLMDGAVSAGYITPQGNIVFNLLTPSGETIGRVDQGSGTRYYYFKDHLGSTRAVVTHTGTVAEVRDFYPFGLHMPGRITTASPTTKENFTGKERDAETGLDYFGARYYHPGIGRWMGVDPLADKFPEWSPYNYVYNNPLRFVDPDGMAPACRHQPCPPPWARGSTNAQVRGNFLRAIRSGEHKVEGGRNPTGMEIAGWIGSAGDGAAGLGLALAPFTGTASLKLTAGGLAVSQGAEAAILMMMVSETMREGGTLGSEHATQTLVVGVPGGKFGKKAVDVLAIDDAIVSALVNTIGSFVTPSFIRQARAMGEQALEQDETTEMGRFHYAAPDRTRGN
jgi:RHS repeat-associated protein